MIEQSLERGLPVSLGAERSILGGIILDGKLLFEASWVLNADDFSLDAHRKIYEAMLGLDNLNAVIDAITLIETLDRRGWLNAIGGIAYLSSLTDGVPERPSIESYVDIVREKARARTLITMGYNTSARLLDGANADDVLPDVQDKLIELVQHGRARRCEVFSAVRETLEELDRNRSSESACIGAPTGIEPLDVLTTGFRDGEFNVIGARPGQGKTALMCQAVSAQIKVGRKPGMFSLEVPRTQIITRLAAPTADISVFDTRDPRVLRETDYNRLREAIAEVSQWKFFIDDTPRLTPRHIAAIARMWIAQGCDCIWIDYLQKIRAPGRGEYESVTAATIGLWELARVTGVPVVALSQLKRLDVDREPTMDDLRASGEIEQSAVLVVMIYRPLVESANGMVFSGEDKLIVAKQRSGPAQLAVNVHFEKHLGVFRPR